LHFLFGKNESFKLFGTTKGTEHRQHVKQLQKATKGKTAKKAARIKISFQCPSI